MHRTPYFGVRTIALAMAILLSGVASQAILAAALTNGGFEDFPVGTTRAANWGAYSISGAITYSRQTTTVHPGGSTISQGVKTPTTSGSEGGIYQTIDAGVGDAFTFKAYAYALSAANYTQIYMGAKWDGSATPPAAGTWLANASGKNVWLTLQGSGNATASNVTLFLDVKRGTNSGDTTTYFDDVAAYRAWVPETPVVGSPTTNSLVVDVTPGGNSANSLAEYAITIGGGGYTLGTNWVQADGSVGAAAMWQTDGTWGTRTVTGLAPGTEYTVQIKARYSNVVTQETALGTVASALTLPEPATLCLLALGGLSLRRRRR